MYVVPPYFMPPFYGGIFNTPQRCDRTKLFFRYVCSMYAYKVFRQLVSNSPALGTAHIHIDFINLSIIYLFPLLTPFLFLLVSILGLKMSSAFFKLNSVLARIIWH